MVQHVHIQPNITNARTTMHIPNNALRADIASAQEQAPEGANELFTCGGPGVHCGVLIGCTGGKSVDIITLVKVEILQDQLWNGSDVIVTVLVSCGQGVHAIAVLATEIF
jgi:hypothetical protein